MNSANQGHRPIRWFAFSLLMSCCTAAIADDRVPLSVAIDRVLQQTLDQEGIKPAFPVSDSEFARRVTLDLAGRIPTSQERQEFLDAPHLDKRERLVDQLLAAEDFAFHARNELDIQLLARQQWNDDWRAYLLEATRENRTWDQLFRELLLPEKLRPEDKGAAAFLKHRAKDLDAMTNDTSTLLFGVNIACAKCHDHPMVSDWDQDHYFGFAQFFKRTFATRDGFLAERFDGDIKFATTSGVERQASFMFLNGESIVEPVVSRTDQEWKDIREKLKQAEAKMGAEPPPVPSFSPREELVSLAFQARQSSLLARNVANRLWARLMGRGLVHPLDQMHSENPASHPEILERLATELVEKEYDTRPLIRGIVLSQAYARGPQLADSSQTPRPEWFAVQTPRPFTPFQYSLSLWIASRNPNTLPGLVKPGDWSAKRAQWEQRAEPLAKRFEIPEEHFQISIEEALLLSNNSQIEGEFLQNSPESLVGHLQTLSDDSRVVDAMYSSILARSPEEWEGEAIRAFLAARSDRRREALQQCVWALLTSAEFRFNH